MIIRFGKKTYHFINRYENLRQLIVYLFVGGSSALSDLILLFIFVDFLKIHYLLAATLSFTIVSTAAFFLHKNYTFRHKGSQTRLRYLVFLLTAGSGLLWSLSLLLLLVDIFKIHYLIAAVMTKFIVLIWNFLVNKFITFGHFDIIITQILKKVRSFND